MCLYKKNIFPSISTKPIKCYKYVHRTCSNKMFRTYYMNDKFLIGKTIFNADCWLFGLFLDELDGEVVHAYTNQKSALEKTYNSFLYKSLSAYNIACKNDCFIECEIPPFTPYWISTDGTEIGAARIKTIKGV